LTGKNVETETEMKLNFKTEILLVIRAR